MVVVVVVIVIVEQDNINIRDKLEEYVRKIIRLVNKKTKMKAIMEKNVVLFIIIIIIIIIIIVYTGY